MSDTPVPVLVTGGAGYVGSHACKALAAAGYLPVTLDNLGRGHESAVQWGPLIKADLHDRAALDAVLTSYRPVAALHFAAFAYVGESVANPGLYYRNNTYASLCLLEALRDHGVKAVVFSSTCATYGIPESLPIRETDPQRPVNPYGESKLMVEQMLRAFGTAHDLRSVILRYFNAAGADADGQIGWHHDPETRVIPRALMAAAGDLPYLEMFGNDFDTPDGSCIRDYIHVSDLGRAHVGALRYLLEGGASTVCNLGTGNGESVFDLAKSVKRVTGHEVPLRMGPRRAGDPPVLVAEPDRARQLLGFSATESSLDHITATAWAWLEKRKATLGR